MRSMTMGAVGEIGDKVPIHHIQVQQRRFSRGQQLQLRCRFPKSHFNIDGAIAGRWALSLLSIASRFRIDFCQIVPAGVRRKRTLLLLISKGLDIIDPSSPPPL